MALIGRVVLPVIGALAAAGFAVLSELPQPTRSDRVGTRVLRFLQTHRGDGSRMSVAGRTVVARCRRFSPRRTLVALSDGNAFVLVGSHIHRRRWQLSTLAAATEEPPNLRAAEADLAGSYALYAAELASQLELGNRVIGHTTAGRGRRVYVVELASAQPRVALVLDRRTLHLLAARFESARGSGKATLGAARGPRGSATC